MTDLSVSSTERPLVVVTGASRGVGRATALRFAREGYRVALLGRPSAALDAVFTEARALGAWALRVPCDLVNRAEQDEAARRILAEGGAPQILVHNAGVIERAEVAELRDESWDLQLEVNLGAPFRLTRALLPAMRAAGAGRILFVSSISAVLGSPRQAAYHAAKAGMVAFMRCLAEELSDTGLMTAAVLPGAIDTDMLRGSSYAPRMTADEVATTLLFLARDASLAHNGGVVEMFGV